MAASWTRVSSLKVVVFVLGTIPAIYIGWAVATGTSGPNPIEFITNQTGEMALRLLIIGLALTPLRWATKSTTPIRFRRMVGLLAYFYVALHFLTYTVLDQQLDIAAITDDLYKRTYIIAGFVALIIMTALAITSTKGMMRQLGKRWTSLHKLVYVAGIASVLHFIWLRKGFQLEPLVYAAVLAVLLGLRVWRKVSAKKKKTLSAQKKETLTAQNAG